MLLWTLAMLSLLSQYHHVFHVVDTEQNTGGFLPVLINIQAT